VVGLGTKNDVMKACVDFRAICRCTMYSGPSASAWMADIGEGYMDILDFGMKDVIRRL